MNEYIERYFTDELSTTDRVNLLKKIESDKELREEFARYQNTQALFSFSDDIVDPADSKRGYNLFLSRIKRQKTYRLFRKSIGYAAAVMLLIVSVHLYHVYTYSPQLLAIPETTLFVPPGQRVSMTLYDGTVVWLNAQTRLTYPAVFRDDERRVSLEGEAYFEVAPDKEKPFIVTAGDVDLKVLGTSFNVYNYAEEEFSRISLLEGSLQVYDPKSESLGIILHPNEEVTIQDGRMDIAMIPNADYFLWKEGIYSFEKEELGVILKKLELYYDIDIIVKKTAILEWEYTVKFRQRDGIDEILRLMQKVHPFSIHKDEENNRIIIDN